MQKTLGFHFCPGPQLLFDCLKKKISDEELLIPRAGFPILDRLLYASEPWNVFNDNDPWEVDYSTEDKGYVERKIYVYVKLRKTGKRFVRTAGCGVWEGSTGYQQVKGDQKGQILGFRGLFNYKGKSDMGVGNSYGEWRMNEFKLGGKDLEGLEEGHIARDLVVCQITQKVDTKSEYYLSWRKGILDLYLDFLEPYGVFDVEEKEDLDAMRNVKAKRPSSESDKNSNKRQRMNEDEDEETDFFPSIKAVDTGLDPNRWQYRAMFIKISDINVQDNSSMMDFNNPDNPANIHVNNSSIRGQDFNYYECFPDAQPDSELQQMINMDDHENIFMSEEDLVEIAHRGEGHRKEGAVTFINECEDNGSESSSRVMNEDEQNEFADELLLCLQNNE